MGEDSVPAAEALAPRNHVLTRAKGNAARASTCNCFARVSKKN